jgi:hypothetical protein
MGRTGLIQNFQKKNPKKTRPHFKNFGENRIQKLVSFRPGKIEKFARLCKVKKSNLTNSF